MKNRLKLIGLAFVATSMLMINGCETTTLGVVPSPNELNPTQADVDFFLNNIQQLVGKLHSGTEGRAENGWAQFGMEPVRIQHVSGLLIENYMTRQILIRYGMMPIPKH